MKRKERKADFKYEEERFACISKFETRCTNGALPWASEFFQPKKRVRSVTFSGGPSLKLRKEVVES